MAALLRLVAWLLAAAVTFVTLGPEDVRPHPVLGQQGDHALAFLIGIFFGLAYPQRRWTVSVVAVALIGLLEFMQLWVPGRHARFDDFVVDALSVCVGFAGSAAANWMLAQLRPRSRRGADLQAARLPNAGDPSAAVADQRR
ncbi:VanZ family protein [Bradyrhizobium lupini]|uniref:VanZ family protein n=1 Tax=Rhizobium lupini TaxID=136996 RepID=UPI00367325B8